ncbi:phosphotransferase [Vibrio sinaloensis]|uniref:phosphotransferase n=1 Tax=Photobacterium sp. (strain ATCC 43367) TaxID=379097 RepID=UPI00068BB7BC|nr:phosphotransferase [Vibrio sinaloensis]
MSFQSKPQDNQIPGIDTLFVEEQVIALVKEVLGWSNVTELRREYLRYKPSSSCLCLYQIKHNERHFLFYLKAYSDKVKVDKAQQKAQSGSLFAETHSHVIETGNLVFNRYPYDTRLPTLERLVDVTRRRDLLQRAFFNSTDTNNTLLTPLQYKPERRFVAKLTLQDGTPLVVKLYTPERYKTLSVSYLKRPNSPFGNIVGKSDKHCMLIYEWVEGSPLNQEDPMTTDQLKHYYLCGARLAEFHHRTVSKKIRAVDTRHFANLIQNHAQSITQILPQQSSLTLWLADQLAQQVTSIEDEKCFIHGDFYADQVLVTSERIEFIDFDNLTTWFSAFDLGNFLSHLRYKSEIGLISKNNYAKIAHIFLDGYLQKRNADRRQIDLFVAIGVFQLIYHPLRFGLADWQFACQRLLTATFAYLTQSLDTQDSFRHLVVRCLDTRIVEQQIKAQTTTPLSIEHATLVRFKEDKRAIVEYSTADGSPEVIIGKIRAKGLDKHSWKTQSTLFQGEFGNKASDNIHVPEPLFAMRELNMWFQKKVSGDNVFKPFCENVEPALAHQLALALYKLHNTELPLKKEHTTAKELTILHDGLHKVAEQQPSLENRLCALIQQSITLSEQLSASELKPIHRDFYHDQVLWDGHKLHLLDFDLMCLGSPYLDLGNFIAHIQEQCLREYDDPLFAQHNINQFVTRYLLLCGHSDAEREIEIYRVLSLIRHISISQRVPERRKFTGSIITLCEDQIESL